MSTMKINVKPLKGDQFEVEVALEAKVADLKKLIEAAKADCPADGQKLIHVGKILKDDDTVESIGIKPTEFLVVMVTKAKPPAAKASPPAAATPAPSAASEPAPDATPAAPGGGEAAATADGGDAVGRAAAAGMNGAGLDAAVTQLMDMGFPQEQVQQCLAAAFGNPDRAVEYLMNGIPDSVRQAAGGGDVAPPAAGGTPGAAAPPATGGAPPTAGGMRDAGPIPPELEAIRNNPQFAQLAGVIAQNPQVIEQLLPALQQSHPDVAEAITRHPQAFLRMVAEQVTGRGAGRGVGGGGGGGAPPGQPILVSLTEDERAAVLRLAEMGFAPNMAMQAYLACDRNEEMAANFLFDNPPGDDMHD